jgi:hypothetical protein
MVRAMREQIRRNRSRKDEEDPNPDRPMREAVIDLVAYTDLPVRG